MIVTFLWPVGWSKVKGGDCKLLDGGFRDSLLGGFLLLSH